MKDDGDKGNKKANKADLSSWKSRALSVTKERRQPKQQKASGGGGQSP
jgi:hypothetical protein